MARRRGIQTKEQAQPLYCALIWYRINTRNYEYTAAVFMPPVA